MPKPRIDSRRRYWMVSPNVNNLKRVLPVWRDAIRAAEAAVMGYKNTKVGGRSENLGYRFAREIRCGDVNIIGRGTGIRRELIACGVADHDNAVCWGGKNQLLSRSGRVIATPGVFGSYRPLQPFESLEGHSISFRGATSSSHAMYELHPEQKSADKRLCGWFAKKLGLANSLETLSASAKGRPDRHLTRIVEPDAYDAPYKVILPAQCRIALRKEARLVKNFLAWAKEHG